MLPMMRPMMIGASLGTISHVQSSVTAGVTTTFSAARAGDIILIAGFYFVNGGIQVDLPAGYTSLGNAAEVYTGYRAAYKVAIGGETSVTFINSEISCASIFRNGTGGGGVLAVGAFNRTATSDTNGYVPALTLQGTNGKSMVAGFVSIHNGYDMAAPAGMSARAEGIVSNYGRAEIFSSQGEVASWPSVSASISPGSPACNIAVELKLT